MFVTMWSTFFWTNQSVNKGLAFTDVGTHYYEKTNYLEKGSFWLKIIQNPTHFRPQYLNLYTVVQYSKWVVS